MKRFLLFALVIALVFTAFTVTAAEASVTVELDGKVIDCKDANGNTVAPLLIDSTTYLPIRAIATALNLTVEWDDETKSVFINGAPEKAEKTDVVNIYLVGVKFIAKDANGKVVTPLLKDGTTYLPVRAIGLAFGKIVEWDDSTKTAILTTPTLPLEIDESKTYAIINRSNGKAISVTDSGLVTEKFKSYSYQGFSLTKTDVGGYYYIKSLSNGKNFDVNGNSKAAGGRIITYNASTADNQKFKLEKVSDGYLIYALSSLLPIEDSAGTVKQNEKRDSIVQRWEIVEFTPVEKADDTVYHTLTIDGLSLTDTESLTAAAVIPSDSQKWILSPNKDGQYIITNKSSSKSLDVANNSKTAGDPIITYKTSSDPNQCWIFEKNSDGTYLIKSVHSSLYLTINNDNTIIQTEKASALKQSWTLTVTD